MAKGKEWDRVRWEGPGRYSMVPGTSALGELRQAERLATRAGERCKRLVDRRRLAEIEAERPATVRVFCERCGDSADATEGETVHCGGCNLPMA